MVPVHLWWGWHCLSLSQSPRPLSQLMATQKSSWPEVKLKHFQNLSLCSQPGGHVPRLEQGIVCLQDQAWLRIHPRYMNVLMNIALEIRECSSFTAIYAAATHNFCILQQWWLHALRFNKSKADLNWLNTHTSTLENLYWKVGSALTLKFHLMSGLRSSVMCGQVAGKGHGSV